MKRLRTLTARVTGDLAPRVKLAIDGEDLLALVRRAEQPFAQSEGVPALAGNYVWPRLSLRLIRLLAGEQAPDRSHGVLFNCECGMAGCWPLSLRVEVRNGTPHWLEIRNAKRAGRPGSQWTYGALGDLRFDRASYEAVLDQLRSANSISRRARVRSELPARSLASKAPGGQRPFR